MVHDIRETQEHAEHELEHLETQTENVERQMNEVEKAIEEIQSTLSRMEESGDREVADAVQKTLYERLKEKESVQKEAEELAHKLRAIFESIHQIDQWNTEAGQEIASLEIYGDMSEAVNRISERSKWVEDEYEKVQVMQQKLDRIIGGFT